MINASTHHAPIDSSWSTFSFSSFSSSSATLSIHLFMPLAPYTDERLIRQVADKDIKKFTRDRRSF